MVEPELGFDYSKVPEEYIKQVELRRPTLNWTSMATINARGHFGLGFSGELSNHWNFSCHPFTDR